MPLKCRKKHIIRANEKEIEDEQDDEPPVAVFPIKDKEKVLTDEESNDDQDNIDAEIVTATTKATTIAAEKKILLDIIALITSGEPATPTPPTTTTQKPPLKSPSQTPKVSSKCKRAQPSRDATAMHASEGLETKRAKFDQLAS